MKNKRSILMFCLVAFLGLLGCGLTDTLISNVVGGSKGNTVSNLWSDVPPIPGAQRLSLDLPVAVQIAIQAMMKASAASGEVNLDKFDWIAFTTPQTPQQVTTFYAVDKMTKAGWLSNNDVACTGGSDTSGVPAAFCVFGKGNTGREQTVLFIVPVQDDQTKQTQVFYVRVQGSVTVTPTPAR